MRQEEWERPCWMQACNIADWQRVGVAARYPQKDGYFGCRCRRCVATALFDADGGQGRPRRRVGGMAGVTGSFEEKLVWGERDLGLGR